MATQSAKQDTKEKTGALGDAQSAKSVVVSDLVTTSNAAQLPAPENTKVGKCRVYRRDKALFHRGLTIGPNDPTDSKPQFPNKPWRSDVSAPPNASTTRQWHGAEVPPFVSPGDSTTELFLLDEVPEGLFAYYREMRGNGSCAPETGSVCRYEIALYSCSGSELWRLPLNQWMKHQGKLEIFDIHYLNGTVFFNEGCQSGANSSDCGFVTAVDPQVRATVWRSSAKTSINTFYAIGRDYLLVAFAHRNVSGHVYLLQQKDGKVIEKHSVKPGYEEFWYRADNVLELAHQTNGSQVFTVDTTGEKAKLIKLPDRRRPSRFEALPEGFIPF